MSDIIRQAEAAGLYVESHTGTKAKVATELYCENCNRLQMIIPVGQTIFEQTHGKCTCSWGCCATAKPTNSPHERHLRHRPVEYDVKRFRFPNKG
jgi:hypothetical protein